MHADCASMHGSANHMITPAVVAIVSDCMFVRDRAFFRHGKEPCAGPLLFPYAEVIAARQAFPARPDP